MIGLVKFIFFSILFFILFTLARVFMVFWKAINMTKKQNLSGNNKTGKPGKAKNSKDDKSKQVIELNEDDYHVE